MIANLMIGLAIFAGMGGMVYLLVSFVTAYYDGDSDADSYDGVRRTDHHSGWKYTVYLLAFKRATDKAAIVKERNAKRDK